MPVSEKVSAKHWVRATVWLTDRSVPAIPKAQAILMVPVIRSGLPSAKPSVNFSVNFLVSESAQHLLPARYYLPLP